MMYRWMTGVGLMVLMGHAMAVDQPLPADVAGIAHRWAQITYDMTADQQEAAYHELDASARNLVDKKPDHAAPLIWEAIVLASNARANGGLGALGMAREARDLLRKAEKIDPLALNGSIYTSLGSLYAKVPGWPIGFGDKDKARTYFEKALKINPDGIDANYFYADFLFGQGAYDKALQYAYKALAAPARTDRQDADAGRRREVNRLIASIKQKQAD